VTLEGDAMDDFLRHGDIKPPMPDTHWALLTDPIRRHVLPLQNAEVGVRLQGEDGLELECRLQRYDEPDKAEGSADGSDADSESLLGRPLEPCAVDRRVVIERFLAEGRYVFGWSRKFANFPHLDQEDVVKFLFRELSDHLVDQGCLPFWVDRFLLPAEATSRIPSPSASGLTSRDESSTLGHSAMSPLPVSEISHSLHRDSLKQYVVCFVKPLPNSAGGAAQAAVIKLLLSAGRVTLHLSTGKAGPHLRREDAEHVDGDTHASVTELVGVLNLSSLLYDATLLFLSRKLQRFHASTTVASPSTPSGVQPLFLGGIALGIAATPRPAGSRNLIIDETESIPLPEGIQARHFVGVARSSNTASWTALNTRPSIPKSTDLSCAWFAVNSAPALFELAPVGRSGELPSVSRAEGGTPSGRSPLDREEDTGDDVQGVQLRLFVILAPQPGDKPLDTDEVKRLAQQVKEQILTDLLRLMSRLERDKLLHGLFSGTPLGESERAAVLAMPRQAFETYDTSLQEFFQQEAPWQQLLSYLAATAQSSMSPDGDWLLLASEVEGLMTLWHVPANGLTASVWLVANLDAPDHVRQRHDRAIVGSTVTRVCHFLWRNVLLP